MTLGSVTGWGPHLPYLQNAENVTYLTQHCPVFQKPVSSWMGSAGQDTNPPQDRNDSPFLPKSPPLFLQRLLWTSAPTCSRWGGRCLPKANRPLRAWVGTPSGGAKRGTCPLCGLGMHKCPSLKDPEANVDPLSMDLYALRDKILTGEAPSPLRGKSSR